MTTRHARPDPDPDPVPGGSHDGLLRRALTLDALASGALGLLIAGAAPVLGGPLGVPAALLLPVGLFLVAFAAAVGLTGTREPVYRPAVWAIIGLNVLWAAESATLVAAGWLPLTALGAALVLAQAGAVALLADLQVLGLRRARPAAGLAVQARPARSAQWVMAANRPGPAPRSAGSVAAGRLPPGIGAGGASPERITRGGGPAPAPPPRRAEEGAA